MPSLAKGCLGRRDADVSQVFFEADLVIKTGTPNAGVMSVTRVFEERQCVECVWYEVNGRRTAIFAYDELLVRFALRPPEKCP
jgi:uncharacterized protein YodC (DUF2158 family)